MMAENKLLNDESLEPNIAISQKNSRVSAVHFPSKKERKIGN